MGPWLGVAALALWAAAPGGAPLAVASAGVVAWVLWGKRPALWGSVGAVTLLVGILAGFQAHRQVARTSSDWSGYWEGREQVVGERLNVELEARLQEAEQAADVLAALAGQGVPQGTDALARIRESAGITALALYDGTGRLLAWDGTHRGKVPEEVQRGLRRYAYGDLPLFGYLYVTAPAGSTGTAVAAVLLRTDLPGPLAADAGDFASSFRREVGEGVRLERSAPEGGSAGWDMRLGDQVLFTVMLDPPSPEARVGEILNRWRLFVSALTLVAFFFLALGAPPRLATGATAATTLLFLAAVLPFQEIGVLGPLFDATQFALLGPWGGSLGRLAAVLLAGVTVVAVSPRPRKRFAPVWAGILAAVAFPVLMNWMQAAATPEALAQGEALWLLYQGAAFVLLTLFTGTVMEMAPTVWDRRALSFLAVALAALLGVGSAVWVWIVGSAPGWWPLLWGLPVALGAASAGAWPGWQRPAASWVLAGLLAGTAAVPTAWVHRVDARRHVAAAYMERLSAPDDPDLERALFRLGLASDSLARSGESGVDLLYGAWRASGLADLGAPAWLTLWSSAGIPEEELRVGVAERPVVAYEVQEDPGPTGGIRILRYDRDDARYVLRVGLTGGKILTAAAPPFADPNARSPLSPLLAGGTAREPQPITLIPVAEPDPDLTELRWSRTGTGWQAELPLAFPNALYHAHYAVPLPGILLALARASLLLVLNFAVFLLFRAAGRGLLRDPLPSRLRWEGWVISFRARVTLALFGFFVLANAIFGTLAYRTIAEASHRAALLLAERVVEDASGWYFEVSGRMQALARRVGVELLEYREGELREGSLEELVELGLYEGWLPMSVNRLLSDREDVRSFTETSLGSLETVTAFRRLPDGDILAAQVPIQAGASAIRAADVIELLAFAVLVGAALSLALALLVGRALTRPIHALQVASERVGAGNLGLRLPAERMDEFGAVFRAFNRMVGRLRRTRRQLVRTTRRTQAIMEEAAVGMMALDPSGRVILVNPRAEGLLEREVPLGEPLPSSGGALGGDLAAWLTRFMSEDRDEGDVELHAGQRRFRIRARRLGTSAGQGGAVVALEDVTDELRTERVLAWGEMARQVAHEVKNPLTPIKLSVQHVQRAWEDGRPDFGAILTRNADAMLQEIDRLAEIAQSFSRFGAPAGYGEAALTAVDVAGVVEEVLALYGASEGPVRFVGSVDPSLASVRARVPEMKEVLVNLLENARAASPQGGVVEVRARAADDGGVVMAVVDQGSGISEAFMPRVFEPHFSTRSTGTGLGLAIVRRLVESWGGDVRLESTEGEGTCVTVHLRPWGGGPDERGGLG